MKIILIVVLELGSMLETLVIKQKGQAKNVLIIGEKGYKIDFDVLKNYLKEEINYQLANDNIYKKVGRFIIFLLPGLNILRAIIVNYLTKYKLLNNYQIKQALVPMSEEERAEYAKIDGIWRKRHFITFIKEEKQEKSKKKQTIASNYENNLRLNKTRKLVKKF